jgi:SNF2 family DNA or RNA helicase
VLVPGDPTAPSQLTPTEALSIAQSYSKHSWRPFARNILHGADKAGVLVNTPDAGFTDESSKILALVPLLEELASEGRKALVFSQFTSLLDLVEGPLTAAGLQWLRLDGSTAVGKRKTLVEEFQGGEASVFLLSLKAGGTGLNLTAADTVVLLDPWWNPAVEAQAADRAHRIGQTRSVTIVRLVAQDTVENGILLMQSEKKELADALLEPLLDALPAPRV